MKPTLKQCGRWAAGVIVVLGMSSAVFAQETVEDRLRRLEKQNDEFRKNAEDLKKQTELLKKQNEELMTLVNRAPTATLGGPVPVDEVRGIVSQYLQEKEATQKAAEAASTADGVSKVAAPTTLSLSEEIAKMLTVKLKGNGKLEIYGFARGDSYYGTNLFYPSVEIPFFALSQDPRLRTGPLGATFFPTVPSAPGAGVPVSNSNDNFTMNARLSRIGGLYTGEKAQWLGDAALEGCIEMDFYNTVDDPIASRAMPRIRLGYAKATWDNGFSVMLGQYWDIISPLYPTINDDLLMWNAGNLGDRRPQLRLNWDCALGDERHYILTVGATATDTVNHTDLDANGYFDGEAAGFPGFQGRTACRTPTPWCNQAAEVGVWGHFSERRTAMGIGLSDRNHFNSYSVGGDWQIPLAHWVALRGEAFYGSMLDDYRGGIDQGINEVLGEEIRSRGGWTELLFKPVPWYQLALGATLDLPVKSDLNGMPFGDLPRTSNWTYYVGNRFPVGGGLTLGLDFEFWHTDYLYLSEGRADRIKFWMQMAF